MLPDTLVHLQPSFFEWHYHYTEGRKETSSANLWRFVNFGHPRKRAVLDSVMAVVPWPTLLATPKMWKKICCFICLIFLLRSSACQASGEDYKGISGESARSGVESKFASGHMSIANMTCKVFEQPLNHFVPRGRSPVYEERYCIYDGFAVSRGEITDGVDKSPIFFYTGNESPLEQYINEVGCSGYSICYSTKQKFPEMSII